MICPKCGNEYPDDYTFCSVCGIPLKKKAKKFNKLLLIPIAAVAVVVVCTVGWMFSNVVWLDLSEKAIKEGTLSEAENYLTYYCPFGYKKADVEALSATLSTVEDYIKKINANLDENDYISAVNDSKEATGLLPDSSELSELYKKSSDIMYEKLSQLYSEENYEKAAGLIRQLSQNVTGDSENEDVIKIREMFADKSAAFLESAQKYYDNYEPGNASENLDIVLAISPDNEAAVSLKSKIDEYNKNKAYMDEAQTLYSNGDYLAAENKFNTADDYTRHIYKALGESISSAKHIAEIDNMYQPYIGSYYDPDNMAGRYTLTVSKVSGGCIWLSFEDVGSDYSTSGSISGASIESGSVGATGSGTAVDYESSSGAQKAFSTNESFTFGNGCVYVTTGFYTSDGDYKELTATLYRQ